MHKGALGPLFDGNSYNPWSAAFVLRLPRAARPLPVDLLIFCNDDGLPALIQSAISRAQF